MRVLAHRNTQAFRLGPPAQSGRESVQANSFTAISVSHKAHHAQKLEEQMSIEEYCEKCGTKMNIVIESIDSDVINYRADCPYCHLGFSAVIQRNQPAPMIRLENGDSPIQ